MNRKISIIATTLALIFALLPLSGCSGDGEDKVPSGMKEISNELVDYNLYVPIGWIEDVSTRFISAYATATDRSSISVEAFGVDDSKMTLDEFWQGYEQDFIATFPDMEYEISESMLLGGAAAMKYVYTATVTGTEYKFMQVTAIRAGNVYIFTYTSLPEKFDNHTEAVSMILENFNFKK